MSHTEINQFQQQIDQLLVNQRYVEALKLIKKKQKRNKSAELIRLEGIVHLHKKNIAMAKRFFKKAIAIDENCSGAMNNLAFIERNNNNYENALYWLNKSISINNTNAEAYHQLGIVQKALGEINKAEQSFLKTLTIYPKHIDCMVNLAVLKKDIGDIKEAIKYLKNSLDINPYQAHTYWVLSNLKSYQFTSNEKQMIDLMLNQDNSSENHIYLLFAQSKYLEDDQLYKESFEVLKQANAMKYALLKHKPTDWSALMMRIKAVFTDNLVNKIKVSANNDIKPVLIAGMPRSGSTLIEQMLSSHSMITGASELDILKRQVSRLKGEYPMSFVSLTTTDWNRFGQEYLKDAEQLVKGSCCFTDKMPENINYAGALLLALPDAKLIHTKRNAMDVCLSNFKQNYTHANEFSYDLKELVEYYNFQNQVAEYWQELFPSQVCVIEYEALINQPQQQIQRLLTFLGFEYEPSCLEFYKNKRYIKTASAGQVTQKIYKTATNYYKNYGDALLELSQLLKQPLN